MRLESFNGRNGIGKLLSVVLSITLATGIVFGSVSAKVGAEEETTEVSGNVEETATEEIVTVEEEVSVEETTTEIITEVSETIEQGTTEEFVTEEETTETETNGNDGTRLIGYYQTWNEEGNPFIKLGDVDENWDVINVAYAEPESVGSTDGKMKFEIAGLTEDYTNDDFKADIKELQAQGKKILLSIGGDSATFTIDTKEAADQFVSDIERYIDEYGFDGIDIAMNAKSVNLSLGEDPDVHNSVSPVVVNLIYAINQIVDTYGEKFFLTMSPELKCVQGGIFMYAGLCPWTDSYSGSYLPLIEALREKLTYINVILYNSDAIMDADWNVYNVGQKSSIVALAKMLLNGFYLDMGMGTEKTEATFFAPLSPSQVVIGVPVADKICRNGYVENKIIQEAFRELNAAYYGVQGIMGWSINYDNSKNNNNFAKENKEFLKAIDIENAERETTSSEEKTTTEEITTEESTTVEVETEPEVEIDIRNLAVQIDGCQISANVEGWRTLYTVDKVIDDKEVVAVGLVYALNDYVKDTDLYVGSKHDYVRSFQATEKGKLPINSDSETKATYTMTMRFAAKTREEYNAQWKIRAYAQLSDGTYVYSNSLKLSIGQVADIVYQSGEKMSYELFRYLYTDILTIVYPGYKEKEYNWQNELIGE